MKFCKTVSVSFGLYLLMGIEAYAGAIATISEYEYAPADGDIILEVSDRIDELLRLRGLNESDPDVLVCRGPGWFAEASAYERDAGSAASAVCGAQTKQQAIDTALRLCDEKTALTCSINYVKYDNDNISFLSVFSPEPDEYGYTFTHIENGATYAFGHGEYVGLDSAPERQSQSTPSRTRAALTGDALYRAAAEIDRSCSKKHGWPHQTGEISEMDIQVQKNNLLIRPHLGPLPNSVSEMISFRDKQLAELKYRIAIGKSLDGRRVYSAEEIRGMKSVIPFQECQIAEFKKLAR